MNILDPDADFPVTVMGNRVYCGTQSSPIAICCSDEMALDVARRLNISDMAGTPLYGEECYGRPY